MMRWAQRDNSEQSISNTVPSRSLGSSEPRKKKTKGRCVVTVGTRGVVLRASREDGRGRSEVSGLDRWSRKIMLKTEHLTRVLYEGGRTGGCYVNTGDHPDMVKRPKDEGMIGVFKNSKEATVAGTT